jgi:hypothetical protein
MNMSKFAPYHDEIAKLVSQYKGRTFTAGEIRQLFRECYLDLRGNFVQASDHCIDHSNKGACDCARTERAIFSYPTRNTYIVL